eukprot:g29976.t1
MQWNGVINDLTSGTVGGVAGIIAGYPLDTIRVRLQTRAVHPIVKNAGPALSLAGRTSKMCRSLFAGSSSGVFKGMLAPIASNAPINAVIFAMYGQSCRLLQEAKASPAEAAGSLSTAPLQPVDSFLAGGVAGFGQSLIAGPSELVKVTLQAHPESHREGSFRCAQKLYQQHGLRQGLLRGTGLTVLRDSPAFASYFYTMAPRSDPCVRKRAVCKDYLSNGQKDKASDLALLTAGGLAGLVSWVVCYPVDVVKANWQSLSPDQAANTTIAQLAHRHYQAEGYRFFTRGLGITCLRSFPVSAITFLVYEKCMAKLSNKTVNVNDNDNADSASEEDQLIWADTPRVSPLFWRARSPSVSSYTDFLFTPEYS